MTELSISPVIMVADLSPLPAGSPFASSTLLAAIELSHIPLGNAAPKFATVKAGWKFAVWTEKMDHLCNYECPRAMASGGTRPPEEPCRPMKMLSRATCCRSGKETVNAGGMTRRMPRRADLSSRGLSHST